MARRQNKGATPLRIENEQTVSLRWLVWPLLLVVMVIVMGAAGLKLRDPATLPINTVRIDTPLQQVEQETIRKIILTHADAGFLKVDVSAVRLSLESLPWVERASVRRSWPDGLSVSIHEQQAIARWANGGLMNLQGVRFKPENEEVWDALPLLRGPDGTEKLVMQSYQKMQRMLRPLGLNISHVSMDERRAWSVQVTGAMHLGLGRHDIERRLLRFVRVYPRVLEPRLAGIESVDLRYTNGFAIRWREGFEPPASV
jgi:cell division protein FtsQ